MVFVRSSGPGRPGWLPRVLLALTVAGLAACGSGDHGGASPGAGGASPGAGGAGGASAGVAGSGAVGGGASGNTGSAGTTGGAGTGSGGSTAGAGGGNVGSAGTSGSAGITGASGTSGGRGGATGVAGAAGTGAAGRGGSNGSGGAGGRGGTGGAGGRGGAGASGAGGGAGGAAGHTGVWKVMPLGDSTTASICYRSHLWQMLTQNGHSNFDFIGTRNGDPGCTFTGYDKDNEGHGGYNVTDLLKAAGSGTRPSGADASDPYVSDARDLATWFDGHPADIVLMHFGTNDVWNGIAPSMILSAYTTILGRLRANNPNVHLYIAQITPLDPSGCSACISRVQTLNGMIPGWATSNATAASPVTVVDQYTGFDATADTRDGVHANDGGSIKIATNWYNVLSAVF